MEDKVNYGENKGLSNLLHVIFEGFSSLEVFKYDFTSLGELLVYIPEFTLNIKAVTALSTFSAVNNKNLNLNKVRKLNDSCH